MAEVDGNRIKELRKELDLSQDELAQRIGVTRQAVNSYEKGKRNPELAALMRLSTELFCTTDFLLGLSDNRTNDASVEEEDSWTILKNALKKHGADNRDMAIHAFSKLLDSVASYRINPYKDKLFRLMMALISSRAEYSDYISRQTERFDESMELSEGETARMFVELHALNNEAMDWEKAINDIGMACVAAYFPEAYTVSKSLYGSRPTNFDKEDVVKVLRTKHPPKDTAFEGDRQEV